MDVVYTASPARVIAGIADHFTIAALAQAVSSKASQRRPCGSTRPRSPRSQSGRQGSVRAVCSAA